MPLVLSYSFVNDFNNCPRKAQHRYVLRDLPRVDTPELQEGRRIHEAFANRLNASKPLPADLARYEPLAATMLASGYHLRAEEPLGMTANGRGTGFWNPQVWARGKIDVAFWKDDFFLSVDWKTGKPREDPLELEIQAALVKANNTDIKRFVGHYMWLRTDTLGPLHTLDPDRGLRSLKKADEDAMALNARGGEWPATPNPLCGFCDVTTCEFNRVKK